MQKSHCSPQPRAYSVVKEKAGQNRPLKVDACLKGTDNSAKFVVDRPSLGDNFLDVLGKNGMRQATPFGPRGASCPQFRKREAGRTARGLVADDLMEAGDEARAQGFTESTGVGQDRLTETGRSRASLLR